MELSKREKTDLLEAFMPSEEMRKYLMDQNISKYDLLELILGAPVRLECKAKWLKRLADAEELQKEISEAVKDAKSEDGAQLIIKWCHERSFAAAYKEVSNALDALVLKSGEIFYLKDKWYDDEILGEKEYGVAPFLSLESALEAIRHDIAECEYDLDESESAEDATYWYDLEKWSPDGNGNMINSYSYTLIGDDIAYFDAAQNDEHAWGANSLRFSEGGHAINLPVPFHAGDIVTINCAPFAPIKHVVLLEVGDNCDCCCVQALYRVNDGTWETGAVKHASVFDRFIYTFSPLYRLKSYTGELSEDEATLYKVSKFIAGNEERGAWLWNELYEFSKCDGVTDESIVRLINEGKNENT